MSKRLILSALVVCGLVAGYFLLRGFPAGGSRTMRVVAWLRNPGQNPEWSMQAGQRCGEAPFLFPTDGYVGFLWGDSFRPGQRHQGIDVFAGTVPGQTPVLAAYPGYLTRLPEWKSSLILRVPSDPLQPARQIWLYYTHLADQNGRSYIIPEFPPGTYEVFVQAGTLLGYQGDYSGDPYNPVGVHLHFSIVLDDGQGRFRNELEIENTLDPSLYFGLPLNARNNRGEIPVCP
jgi:peptidoglycan LD-endopeptidase LytH